MVGAVTAQLPSTMLTGLTTSCATGGAEHVRRLLEVWQVGCGLIALATPTSRRQVVEGVYHTNLVWQWLDKTMPARLSLILA
jgi:hypothetical protein